MVQTLLKEKKSKRQKLKQKTKLERAGNMFINPASRTVLAKSRTDRWLQVLNSVEWVINESRKPNIDNEG